MNHINSRYYIAVCCIALCISACNESSDKNRCNDIDCGGYGVCVQDADDVISCVCQTGYRNSEDNLFLCVPDTQHLCDTIYCGGHGVCFINKDNQAACNCENHYHNSLDNPLICEPDYVEPPSCDGVDCNGHGDCLIDTDNNQVTCDCDLGYTNSVLDPLLCVQDGILGDACEGFDCSGLVKLAYFMNGVILPRNSSQMVRLGIDLDVSHVLEGDFSTLREGDLLFFGNKETGRVSHVALYIGGGRILHASQVVRNNALTGNGPDAYENAWRLLYGRRILGTPDAVPITDSPFYFVQE